MSKETELAAVVGGKVAALYASGNETQIAVFEALERQSAAERGDSPDAAVKNIINILGASLLNEKAGIPSSDRTVEIQEVEKTIIDKLAARGDKPEDVNMQLAVLKNIGALMAGGGVAAGQGDSVTPSHVPNVAEKSGGPPIPL